LNFFKSSERYEEELAWIMDAVKERRDKCPKIIIYVNSIAMCETLYIWLHSELKKDAYKDEMSIENRMVEMYHAHTDEDTKLRIMSKFSSEDSTIRVLIATVACGMGVNIPDISIVILWGLPPSLLQMWQEIGRCGRDGRSGIAICYAYARSISMPCDKCRKERKYQCKCNDREYLRSAVTVEKEHCQRMHCLKHFLLEGMDSSHIKMLENKKKCSDHCDTACECSFCKCCISCIQNCKCSETVVSKKIVERYWKE
jgi:superfamily II DNA helicase RecQ